MKSIKNIFSVFSDAGRAIAFGGIISALMFTLPAYSATDNGCGDDNNDRITPELALCSTHVYNIGLVSNPTNDSDKQLMRDVVALKTTIMTQQLKKQYDFLEATISRFKTQLQKAVLTAQLEAAGAPSSSSSSSSASSDRNVVLLGAENCLLKSSTSDGLSCIQNNIRIALQAVSTGNIGEAYRQLQKDLEFASAYSISGVVYDTDSNKYTKPEPCTNLTAQRDSVNNCAYALNIAVMQAIENQQNKSRQNTTGPQQI